MDEEEIHYHWTYTDAQSMILCLAGTLSGCLSVFGSGSIIYSVLSDKKKLSRLYERYVMAVSCADIMVSLSYALGVYMVPSHTDMIWAFGNDVTCSFSSFLFTFIVAVSFANANLALYFYFSVCRGWNDEYIAKHYERKMHVAASLLATTIATIVVATKSGNPAVVGHLCVIEKYPPSCKLIDDVECTRGGNYVDLIWTIILLCQFISTVVAIAATVQVTRTVLRSTRRAHAAGSDAALRRQQRVMKQAVLYLCSYLNTLFWPFLLVALTSNTKVWEVHQLSAFLPPLLAGMFMPLQGLFNYFIFRRSSYKLCSCLLHREETSTRDDQLPDSADNPTSGTSSSGFFGQVSKFFRPLDNKAGEPVQDDTASM